MLRGEVDAYLKLAQEEPLVRQPALEWWGLTEEDLEPVDDLRGFEWMLSKVRQLLIAAEGVFVSSVDSNAHLLDLLQRHRPNDDNSEILILMDEFNFIRDSICNDRLLALIRVGIRKEIRLAGEVLHDRLDDPFSRMVYLRLRFLALLLDDSTTGLAILRRRGGVLEHQVMQASALLCQIGNLASAMTFR